jgi:hypothetical protein
VKRPLLLLAAVALVGCSFSQRTKIKYALDISVDIVKTARAQLGERCLNKRGSMATIQKCIQAWKIMLGVEKALRVAYEALGHDAYDKASTYLAIAREGMEKLLEAFAEWDPPVARRSP